MSKGVQQASSASEVDAGQPAGDRATTFERQVLLRLLVSVSESGATSQRGLAQRAGAALGLTNALLKRCVRKGLIKVREVPARRFAYYLTPKGFTEKSRLTAEYVSDSLSFFRTARGQYATIFNDCRTRGLTRVALYGPGDLADIARLAAEEAGVELVGIIVPGANEATRQGLPVFPVVPACDAVVLTDASAPQDAFEALSTVCGAASVLAPPLLNTTPPAAPADG